MNITRAVALAGVCGATAIGLGTVMPAGASTPSSPSSASPAASTDSSQRCDDGHWPLVVDGRPTSLQAGAAEGVYVWHGTDGWHVAVTHPGHHEETFDVKITSQAPLVATEVRDEHDDVVLTRNDDHTAVLHAENYGYIDGMDVRTACSPRIEITGTVDGQQLTTDEVIVGHGNRHPSSVPFVVTRRDPR